MVYYSRFLFCGIAALIWVCPAHADLTITATTDFTDAGQTGSVTFFAEDDDGAAGGVATLAGYNLTLDIGGDGLGVPGNLTFVGVAGGAAFGDPSYTLSPGVAPFNWDAGVAFSFSDGSSVALNSATELFTLTYLVDGGTPDGSEFDIAIVNPPAPNSAALSFTGDNIGDPINTEGALTGGKIVVGIPEPSSVVIMALLGLGGMATSRRRIA
jgi:hypothetical protein